jgi:hypothetical protein
MLEVRADSSSIVVGSGGCPGEVWVDRRHSKRLPTKALDDIDEEHRAASGV